MLLAELMNVKDMFRGMDRQKNVAAERVTA
jgi:hypothetical protein